MYGDLSRDSFDAQKQYQRVLMQQGRPLTDADWNEQASLIADSQWQLVRSLLGRNGNEYIDHGTFDGGFKPEVKDQKLTLAQGSYWASGLRCVLTSVFELPLTNLATGQGEYDVSLEAWEHTISPAADGGLLEPALGMNDTSWRTTVAWRIVVKKAPEPLTHTLRVRRKPSTGVGHESPCSEAGATSSIGESLYRVEIHRSGKSVDPASNDAGLSTCATFKWSRTNASDVFAIENPAGTTLNIDPKRYSSATRPVTGTFLELRDQKGRSVDADQTLRRVTNVSGGQLQIETAFSANATTPPPSKDKDIALSGKYVGGTAEDPKEYHVQAWHHRGTELASDNNGGGANQALLQQGKGLVNGALVVASNGTDGSDLWIDLEYGIQIQFERDKYYSEGDYWLIRTSAHDDRRLSGLFGNNAENVLPIRNSGGPRTITVGTLRPFGGNWSVEIGNDRWNLRPLCLVQSMAGTHILHDDASVALLSEMIERFKRFKCLDRRSESSSAGADDAMSSSDTATPAEHAAAANGPREPVLSPTGQQALRKVVASPLELARHLPARWLNYAPRSAMYRRFRAPLLLLDILKPTFDDYFAAFERCARPTEDERELARDDARHDYELAQGCRKMLVEGEFEALFA